VSIASPLVQPSPNGRRVGIRIVTFEACSGFTRVTVHRIAQPPKATFVTRLQPCRSPGRAARQLPDQSTTLWVDSSSTGDSRRRGALPTSDVALKKSLEAIHDQALTIAIALHPESCTMKGSPRFGWTVECLGVPKHHYSDVTFCSPGVREVCVPAPPTWTDCVSYWWDIDLWGRPSNPNGTGGTVAELSDTCREKATISEDREEMRRRGLSPEKMKVHLERRRNG
jgi:hypothetical protein